MNHGIVEDYLAAVARQDWDTLHSSVCADVVRQGPFGDTYAGREAYVEFLANLMPTLPGYSMSVDQVTYVDDGRRAFAELSETVLMNGEPVVTPEVLVFDLDSAGLISRIVIYTRRAAASATVTA